LRFQKEEIYEVAPLCAMFGWMWLTISFIRPNFPELEAPFGFIGFILISSCTVIVDLIYLKITGPYPFVNGICTKVQNQTFRFYIQDFEKIDVPTDKGYYSTTVNVKWASEYPGKGKIEKLVIHHRGLFADRVEFVPGRAQFQGEWFNHPATARLWFEELELEKTDIERGAPIPVLWLARGNKDGFSRAALVEEFLMEHPGLLKSAGSNPAGGGSVLDLDMEVKRGIRVEEILSENRRLKRAIREMKRRSMKDHTMRLATEEETDLIKSELDATLDIPTKQSMSLTRTVLALYKAAGTIDNMRSYVGRRRVSPITRNAVILIMFLASLIYLGYRPDIVDKIFSYASTYWYVVLGIAGIMAAAWYYYKKR